LNSEPIFTMISIITLTDLTAPHTNAATDANHDEKTAKRTRKLLFREVSSLLSLNHKYLKIDFIYNDCNPHLSLNTAVCKVLSYIKHIFIRYSARSIILPSVCGETGELFCR
jgi:hypothetical protein